MYNILICDDEKDIVNALKIYLSGPEYTTFEAYNGREALKILREREIHLILMDIMMPLMDGITALEKIREDYNIPVILLSAKGEETDKILGLNSGRDDYVTKPFNPMELQARVRSRLRRYTVLGGSVMEEGKLKIGGIELDDVAKTVSVDGENKNLTPTEFEILRLLMHNPGKVYSPEEIYEKVWGSKPYGGENTVVVHIRHLREKIEINPAEPRYLKVVWGHGYKIDEGFKQ